MPTCPPRMRPKRILETDLRAGVEPEQVSSQIAEITSAERPAETMRDAEGALVSRQAQRGRQVDDREVRLREPGIAIGSSSTCAAGAAVLSCATATCWPQGGKHGDRRDDS